MHKIYRETISQKTPFALLEIVLNNLLQDLLNQLFTVNTLTTGIKRFLSLYSAYVSPPSRTIYLLSRTISCSSINDQYSY